MNSQTVTWIRKVMDSKAEGFDEKAIGRPFTDVKWMRT